MSTLKNCALLLVLAVSLSISRGFQVSITNDSGVNTNLTVHCRSGSRDLGRHAIEYEDEFIWEININIGSQTTYDSESNDGSTGGQCCELIKIKKFNKQRDALRCGDQICFGEC